MNRESILDKLFAVWATRRGWRTFRNSVGVGYVGRELRSYPASTKSGATLVFEVMGRRIRFGLCEGQPYRLDITFRMLQPHELAAAQGFPVEHRFAGTKTDRVRQIGNAVPPGLARALVLSGLGAA